MNAPETPMSGSTDDTNAGVVLFPVSGLKLALMSISTIGLYEIYWFYRNWDYLKRERGLTAIPLVRALLTVVYVYPMLRRVRAIVAERDVRLGAEWLSAAYVALVASVLLPDPYWVVSAFSFVPLLPVVGAINRVNEGRVPAEAMNRRFTAWNLVVIVAYSGLWAYELASRVWQ